MTDVEYLRNPPMGGNHHFGSSYSLKQVKEAAAEITRLRADRAAVIRECATDMAHAVHGAVFETMVKVQSPAPSDYSEAAVGAIKATALALIEQGDR